MNWELAERVYGVSSQEELDEKFNKFAQMLTVPIRPSLYPDGKIFMISTPKYNNYEELLEIAKHPRKHWEKVCMIDDDIWDQLINDLDSLTAQEPLPLEKEIIKKFEDHGTVPPVIEEGVYCSCDNRTAVMKDAGAGFKPIPYEYCTNCKKEIYNVRYSKK